MALRAFVDVDQEIGASTMANAVATTKPAPKGKIPPAVAAVTAKSPSGKASASKTGAAKASAKTPVKTAIKPATPKTISLKDLAAGIAERHDLPKKQADTLIADLFGRMVDHLKAGERLRIGGLGIIEVKDRAARMGRNPATGEAIQIKASRKIAFRAAKELKDAI